MILKAKVPRQCLHVCSLLTRVKACGNTRQFPVFRFRRGIPEFHVFQPAEACSFLGLYFNLPIPIPTRYNYFISTTCQKRNLMPRVSLGREIVSWHVENHISHFTASAVLISVVDLRNAKYGRKPYFTFYCIRRTNKRSRSA